MDFQKLAAFRYSVRSFQKRPVEKEKLDVVLEAGRVAPTASNTQPQRILVIREEEGLAKVDLCTPCRFGAPVVLLVCYDETVCWKSPYAKANSGQVDASIITDHMMLQAADIGLGATWVMRFDPMKAREEFALPDQLVPVSMLILGYPAEDAAPSERHNLRFPKEKTVFYDSFT